MKTLGIIGGVGPETTANFYMKIINSLIKKGCRMRPSILISNISIPLEFEEDLIMKNSGVERYLPVLIDEAKRLEKAGSDFVVLPSNTLHIFQDKIKKAINIDFLSIVDETINFIEKSGYKKVGFLATNTTIEHDLYATKFQEKGIEQVLPSRESQQILMEIIMDLVLSRNIKENTIELRKINQKLQELGAEIVILACTDLQLAIKSDTSVPVFDTMDFLAKSSINKLLE